MVIYQERHAQDRSMNNMNGVEEGMQVLRDSRWVLHVVR